MSPVLAHIAARYLSSRAGRTGFGARDCQFIYKDLLREIGVGPGPDRDAALHDLKSCERQGLLVLEPVKRDRSLIQKVRLPLDKAEAFLVFCGLEVPSENRSRIAQMFQEAANLGVPEKWASSWRTHCVELAHAAHQGLSVEPFDLKATHFIPAQMRCAAGLLAWNQESYLRFASCVLCGNSKTLAQWQPRLERFLTKVTDGEISNLAMLGITESGGGCWLHGPGILHCVSGGQLPLDATLLPIYLSRSDLENARIQSGAARWMTVENQTMLFELARQRSDTLLISSGFHGGMANTAVVDLLRAAPEAATLWHFGDSDVTGFDILRDLRCRTGRKLISFQMRYRSSTPSVPLAAAQKNRIHFLLDSPDLDMGEKQSLADMLQADDKGIYEQESLGFPGSCWPFYSGDF